MTNAFEYIEQHIILEVEINQRPARMIFDTGAGITSVDKRFCEKHSISIFGEFTAPTATGNLVTGQFAHGVSLRLGNYKTRPNRVAVLDLSFVEKYFGHIDGVLGVDVLLDIPVTINFPDKKLEFGKNIPLGYKRVPLEIVHRYNFMHDVYVELLLEGRVPVKAELDTGGYPLRLQEKYLDSLGIKEFEERSSGDFVKEQKAKSTKIRKVSFLANKNIIIDDVLVYFEKLEIEGLAGNCLLENHTVCFDFGSEQMYLSERREESWKKAREQSQ